MNFKEYCIKTGMVATSSNSYNSIKNKGLEALRNIIENSDQYDEVRLLDIFLANKNDYKVAFKTERNNVIDCFQDFVSVGKKYLEYKGSLSEINIWKISHGNEDTKNMRHEWFENNQISLHKNTRSMLGIDKTQADFFRNDLKIGDIVFICHSNDIKRLAKVTSEILNPADDWICREYMTLDTLDGDNKYSGTNKWWTPDANTTFQSVKKSEYCNFENWILEPFFNKTLQDIGINSTCDKATKIKGKSENIMNKNTPSLNQILYGPPGTGKTYSTVEYALKILGAEDRKDEIKSIGQLQEAFGSQVEFVTFHQSFSYEDFVEGLKANSDGDKLTYDVESGIFKTICENAKKSGNNSLEKLNKAIQKLREQVEEESLRLKTLSKGKEFSLTVQNKSGFYAKPDAGESSNPVNVVSIEAFYKNPKLIEQNSGAIFKSYVLPVVKYMKENFNLQDYEETEDQKPHVLIIDEINRGNISRIFGELITLIEGSKRTGNNEEISVQLPYSKTPFSVPNNLYIIGTMNTADRSLTLMDTALRRRFDFVEMLPDADLVKGNFDNIDVQKILKTINQRIEVLYDKEHLIGHSFLMYIDSLEELRNTFKNKILPLLEEYFYDDFSKIKAVLNDKDNRFYQEVKQDENLFADMEVEYNKEQKIYNRQSCDELTADNFINIYNNIPEPKNA
ncbi:MAG: hypothetical protein Ctma_0856 [Catillopecten margaritatus gill symbiont]|uniref:AAA+ ATPase domain-containing protein n=1 Tax=Catillopecten margaritatus gill symbiont TaxID=3083288 RepID=A0AAU6PGK7_9GAMM